VGKVTFKSALKSIWKSVQVNGSAVKTYWNVSVKVIAKVSRLVFSGLVKVKICGIAVSELTKKVCRIAISRLRKN
jgi:hypothetical protein